MGCLWFISVLMYSNIILIVTFDLFIYTRYHTWINFVLILGTSIILYIIFLVIVHNWDLFNSYASIEGSVSASLFWLNLILVTFFCIMIDFAIKAAKYIFFPNLSRTLQILYTKYGRLDTDEHLPFSIKQKLNMTDFYSNGNQSIMNENTMIGIDDTEIKDLDKNFGVKNHEYNSQTILKKNIME